MSYNMNNNKYLIETLFLNSKPRIEKKILNLAVKKLKHTSFNKFMLQMKLP